MRRAALFDVTGQALQQEFGEFANAGLSLLKTLQMTIIDPARFLHCKSTMDRVAPGMAANVLLTSNPARVSNPGANSAVIHAGRDRSHEQRDRKVRDLRNRSTT